MDIAIINTRLLTFSGNNVYYPIVKGALGIEDDKIAFIGKTEDFNYKQADIIIDGTDHITMPGLINAHTHSGQTILRGSAQDLPEIEWMNKGIGPFSKHLSSEDVFLGAKLAIIEGLKSGTTTFTEYARSVSNLIHKAHIPFKVRIVAIETINEISSDRANLKPTDLYEFDRTKGERALKTSNDLFNEFKNNDLVSTMYGPQALDMCSLELLAEIQQQAIDHNCNIHMHVAQGKRERLQIIGRYGKDSTSISVLKEKGLLNENLIAAHIHDTSTDERELMVNNGVKMVGCPSSISTIDGIVPPIGHYITLGGKAGLGTDQAPGPGHHNLFQEMKIISVLTKVINKDPTALPPWQSLKLVTIGGASVLGIDKKIGSLEIGKQADIITIDLKNINLTPIVDNPFRNFIPNLVYSSTGHEVDNVIINGKLILAEKKLVAIDESSIIIEANKRAKEIFEEATEDWVKAGSKMVSYRDKGFL